MSFLTVSNELLPSINSLAVENTSEEGIKDLNLVISFEPGFGESHTISFRYLAPKSTSLLSPNQLKDLSFDPAFFASLNEKVEGKIRITAYGEGNGESIFEDEVSIDLLPYDAIGGTGKDKLSYVASFIDGKSYGARSLAKDVRNSLSKGKTGTTASGYREDREGVQDQFEAVLKSFRKKEYDIVPQPVYDENTFIRINHPALSYDLTDLTPLDAGILAASAIECLGLHPVFARSGNTFYVGGFLDEDGSLSNAIEDSTGHVISLIEQGELYLVDAGKMNKLDTFPALSLQAKAALSNSKEPFQAIDIALLRESGSYPLPLKFENGVPSLDVGREDGKDLEEENYELNESDHDSIQAGFDKWERELLDLSMTNPLLNLKIKSRVLSVIAPDLDGFLKGFTNETKFSLIYRDGPQLSDVEILQDSMSGDMREMADTAFRGKRLVTYDNGADYKDKGKKIYRRYRDNLNESGANILYMTLGLLKYYESDQAGIGSYRLAPIVLIPIEMVADSKNQFSYTIKQRDDEWLVNTTLVEYMKKVRDVDLSAVEKIETDEEGHLDYNAIIDALKEATDKTKLKTWDVIPSFFSIGCFDFTRYCMWEDMRTRRSQMEKNTIVRSLAVGRKEWSASSSNNPIQETDCCIPLVADSSQINAIRNCADGKSFVLFGPPGTGKSQTIVNMIANSLYNGKQVLFVSEKQAALDVVYKRLKNIGLDPFCLQLHDAKANKAEVLGQFSTALANAKLGEPSDFEKTKEDVESLKQKLTYDNNIFKKKGPCFMSINDCLIGYEQTKDYNFLPRADKELVRSLDVNSFNKVKDIATRIGYLEYNGHFGEYKDNCLMPLRGHAYGLGKRDEATVMVDELIKKAQTFSGTLQRVRDNFRPNFQFSRKNTDCLIKFIQVYLESERPKMLTSGMETLQLEEDRESIEEYLDRWVSYRDRKAEEIDPFLNESVLDDPYIVDYCSEIKGIDLTGGAFKQGKMQKTAQKALSKYAKSKIEKKNAIDLLYTVAELSSEKKYLDEHKGIVIKTFRSDFADISSSDPHALRASYDYSVRLLSCIDPSMDEDKRADLVSCFLDFIGDITNTNVRQINTLIKNYNDLQECSKRAKDTLDIDLSYFKDESGYYTSLPNNLNHLKEKLPFASEWANLTSAIDELKAMDFGYAIEALNAGKVTPQNLCPAIECSVYLSMAMLSIEENNLEGFSGLSEEATIAKYNEECEEFRKLSIAKLQSKLSKNIPSDTYSALPNSELGYLKKAIASNGHGQSIKKILSRAENLVRTLCPCFLMSPTSAATYLSPDMNFDIVIFDEASQIPTAEAIGPISRGKSVIVCGDGNQLPPTSFFKTSSEASTDFLSSSLPSILEECRAILLPEQELRWHYRSRSETLIAFSNHEFYFDSLYTFPSVDDQTSAVRYINVQSAYDRSRTRTNAAEADAIVKEVIRRKKDPDLKLDSIGIIAFSQAQKDLIEDKLDDALVKNKIVEGDEISEPIFVKNLENVQGDERDVIIFSIGYGLDKNGKLSMNFGPINSKNGFRRLNVAISRARKEMLVYTNIDPDLYREEDIENPGAQYLFRFLRYAKHGRKALAKSSLTQNAPYEAISESVAKALREKGYMVDIGVGDSAFRLNLAVTDQLNTDEYLLGIMIEGEKDNDYELVDKLQIQPSVLKGLGWRTMRVYAIDWVNSPSQVLTDIENNFRIAKYEKSLKPSEKKNPKDYEKKIINLVDSGSKRKEWGSDYLIPEYTYYKPADYNSDLVLKTMGTIIASEGPVSQELLLKRIKKCFNLTKMKDAENAIYNDCLEKIKAEYTTTSNMDGTLFFWKKGQNPSTITCYRKGSGNSDRMTTDIPREEIAAAICDILYDQFGVDKDSLARALIDRMTNKAKATAKNLELFNDAIDWAVLNRTDFLTVTDKGLYMIKS